MANTNPQKAQQAITNLIEEQFPEQKFERSKAVERALEIMEKERKKVFSVSPLHPRRPRGLIRRVNKVLNRGS